MMHARLYWIDGNGSNHVIDGDAVDLIDHAKNLDMEGTAWKLTTLAYTTKSGDSE